MKRDEPTRRQLRQWKQKKQRVTSWSQNQILVLLHVKLSLETPLRRLETPLGMGKPLLPIIQPHALTKIISQFSFWNFYIFLYAFIDFLEVDNCLKNLLFNNPICLVYLWRYLLCCFMFGCLVVSFSQFFFPCNN